jgi:hypothetical protein
VPPAKAPEVAKKLEPVALQAGEVAALPVPVAPTMRRSSPGKVAEADRYHAGCVIEFSKPC